MEGKRVSYADDGSMDSDIDELDEISIVSDEESKISKREHYWALIGGFLDGTKFTAAMMLITLYALFGDDTRLAAFGVNADPVFEVLTSIAFFAFLLELIAQSIFRTDYGWAPVTDDSDWLQRKTGISGYLFSFFFWLDFISTISLVPDVWWLWGAIIGYSQGTNSVSRARAARISRAGRAGRVTRVSRAGSRAGRMVRLAKVVKGMIKAHSQLAKRDRDPISNERESQVGSKLSGRITRRVIIMVLVVLILVPIFSTNDIEYVEDTGLLFVHGFNEWHQPGWESAVDRFRESVDKWSDDGTPRLIYLSLEHNGVVHTYVNDTKSYDNLRDGLNGQEVKYLLVTSVATKTTSEAWFNERPVSVLTATYSSILTVLVIFLLAGGSLVFASDAQRLVLRPIEQMVAFVERMSQDPTFFTNPKTQVSTSGQFETNLLQNTIMKIGGLVRVGFGQAGASIIAKNLQAGSQLDPMVEGRMMHAIFGFASINGFNNCTEVLQTDVLVFVNNISKIVHEVTMAWGGAPNKNMGEAYLLTWVLEGEEQVESPPELEQVIEASKKPAPASPAPSPAPTGPGGRRGSTSSSSSGGRTSATILSLKHQNNRGSTADLTKFAGATVMADQALIGVLKIMAELSRAPLVQHCAENELMQKAVPGFYVHLQYGLHVGWAIEGAIGSLHKVDASYLSPHVNIAARMYAASKQYGVALLVSGPFHQLLSSNAQKYCRKLDVVAVKGSKLPLDVYTYDVWEWRDYEPRRLLSYEKFIELCEDPTAFKKHGNDHEGEVHVAAPALGPYDPHPHTHPPYSPTLWETDQVLVALRAPFTDKFRKRFKLGVDLYVAGKWPQARVVLETTLNDPNLPTKGGDGPSRTLLMYMKSFQFRAPPDWKGFRALTSK